MEPMRAQAGHHSPEEADDDFAEARALEQQDLTAQPAWDEDDDGCEDDLEQEDIEEDNNNEQEEEEEEPPNPTGDAEGTPCDETQQAVAQPLPETAKSEPKLLFHYQTDKAGMAQADKQRINKIIFEASKGSRFFQNEQRKDARTKERIRQLQAKWYNILVSKKIIGASPTRIERVLAQIDDLDKFAELCKSWYGCTKGPNFENSSIWKEEDALISRKTRELEVSRDLSQTWIHVDMDAFYAAVEIRDNPSLKGRPIAVGGDKMISTSSYEARVYGVRSAQPGFIAKRLCPQLILVKPNFSQYIAVSREIKAIFKEYDPNVKMNSLDEANLHVASALSSRNSALPSGQSPITGEQLAEEIRRRVFEKVQLTCSAGIGCNRMLSKICSDVNKPNGQFALPNDRDAVMKYVAALPVRKIPGIGKVSEMVLRSFGIVVVGDIFSRLRLIYHVFYETSFDFYLRISLGLTASLDDSHANDEKGAVGRRSVGAERTFRPTQNAQQMRVMVEQMSDNVASELQRKNLAARTVTIKLKTSDFTNLSRSHTVVESTPSALMQTASVIRKHALSLFEKELQHYNSSDTRKLELRLLGVRMSGLVSTNGEDKDSRPTKSASSAKRAHPIEVGQSHTLDKHLVKCSMSSSSSTTPSGTAIGGASKSSGQRKISDFFRQEGDTATALSQHSQHPQQSKIGMSMDEEEEEEEAGESPKRPPPSSTPDGSESPSPSKKARLCILPPGAVCPPKP